VDKSLPNCSPSEVRVLGCLMEKAVTTPESYPLTLNALVNACNQKTSRDPITQYDEDEVMDALDALRDKHLALRVDVAGSRVPKFRHIADKTWELEPAERALLTVMLLRGPQTVGQLRQRTERLYAFPDLSSVERRLDAMMEREEPPQQLVMTLDKHIGGKETRYVHRLMPSETYEQAATESAPPVRSVLSEKVEQLEARIDELENRLKNVQEAFDTFRNEFN